MPTTKITKGKSFARAIDYDLGQGVNGKDQAKIKLLPATKDEAAVKGFAAGQRARLLAANVVGDTPAEIAAEFEKVAAARPGIKEPVHKVSINLRPGEHLETRQWLAVGHSYLKAMGFADAPSLIAQHREKDHEHIHIVASRVRFDGTVVPDSFEQKRAKIWARDVEEQYDLSRTPEKSAEKGLSRIEIEQAIRMQKPPPKLILQQSIAQTLAAYPETPDFIDALERQNISIRVKTKEEEIVGVSFGIGGHGFKGGSLGTKFTWAGLQKGGLNYEFERDYERLEEASRSRSDAQSQSAGSKLDDGESVALNESAERAAVGRANVESIEGESGIAYPYADRIAESDRLGGQRSGRTEAAGNRIARIEIGNEAGSEQSTTQPISIATTETERVNGEGDGAVESRDEGGLRRARRFDPRETETARRAEPENGETIAAEETDETFAAESARQRQIERHEHAEARFFRQLEGERQRELFNQSSVGGLPAGAELQPIRGGLLPATSAQSGSEASGAGAGVESSALDGMGGPNLSNSVAAAVADVPTLQGNLGVLQTCGLSDDGYAGSVFLDSVSTGGNLDGSADPDRNSLSGGESDDSVQSEVANLSANLRSALDYAESTAKETLEVEASLKAEEIKKLKIEKQEIEFEEVISRGLSM